MRFLLKFILTVYNINGFDPRRNSGFKKIGRLISFTAASSLVLQNLLEILLNWQGVSTIKKIYLISILTNLFAVVLTLLTKSKTFLDILRSLESLWEPTNAKCQQMVDSIHKRVVIFAFSYYASCLLVSIQIIVFPLIGGKREMIFGGYELCDLENDLCYTVIFVWHTTITYLHLLPCVLPFEGLYMFLITQIYCSIEVLKDVIGGQSVASLSIGEIVQQHDFVLGLVRDVDKFFGMMLITQYFNSLVGMTFCLYMVTFEGLSSSDKIILVNFSVLYVVLAIELFFYSFGGLIIKEQTESMALAIYSTDWYTKQQPQLRKKLWFMMQRAHKYERLTIGGMAELDLVSYLAVLRSSFSILTLLMTIETP